MSFLPDSIPSYSRYNNSLLYAALLEDPRKLDVTQDEYKEYPGPELTKSIGLISALYIYTNTPPHGYGTQAPKVAETLNRTAEFNRKREEGKPLKLSNGMKIERFHWEEADGVFPHEDTHGNFDAFHVRKMAEKFLVLNHEAIDRCADGTIEHILHTNADLLTKGRQTLDVMSGNSVTAAKAYSAMYSFLKTNTGEVVMSGAEWMKNFITLLDKEEVSTKIRENTVIKKKEYDRALKMFVYNYKTKSRMTDVKMTGLTEVRNYLLKIAARFTSYLKQKERGKKDRRAIASANMVLRMPLYAVEHLHLALSKEIEGSTIAIGGEEKKKKITTSIGAIGGSLISNPLICQGTEDATKWNECLSPSIFALMHKVFFDPSTRLQLSLPPPSESGLFMYKIALYCHFLQAIKSIALGPGPMAQSEEFFNRLEWSDGLERFNKQTQEWLKPILRRKVVDGSYANASGGMLMGMLNAASTTLGLLPTNYRMDPWTMQVICLRSSDDSMSIYMGSTRDNLINCIEVNRQNLSLAGINFSDKKTIFFQYGYGEYTSWYFQGDFKSQFGVETASLRPAAKNPSDDFNAAAKGTATALSTLTINAVGAEARLRLAIDGIRRLWRIQRTPAKRKGISDLVLLLADGGRSPWTCMNCHLEETCLKEKFIVNESERQYILCIRNPENPFSQDPEEEVTYSKELGCLTLNTAETPRTVFNYVKRTNRTVTNKIKQDMFKDEKANSEVVKIVQSIDPTTIVGYPNTGVPISKHLFSILSLEGTVCDLSPEEHALLTRALDLLRTGDFPDSEEDENDDSLDL